MTKNHTCHYCTQCGKSDTQVDLFANIVISHILKESFILLQCKECLENHKVQQKYGYKIPIYLPDNKTMEIIVKNKPLTTKRGER